MYAHCISLITVYLINRVATTSPYYVQHHIPGLTTMDSNHLKPPASRPQHRTPSSSSSTTPSAPRPPTTIHPTATVADHVLFEGTHPVTIDAETIIHPRVRLYTYDGPIQIGAGCIIGEKCVLGSPPAAGSTAQTGGDSEASITIFSSVSISPASTISPGARIADAAIIETAVTIHPRARIGAHTKICSRCEVPVGAAVDDWTVAWGSGQRRKRAPLGGNGGKNGTSVEESRLVVLRKEREALARLVVSKGASSRR